MYALYVASEEEAFCREHDAEIVSIAYRIQEYSTDDDCRNEARCWLFRHYCDTNRKAQALQIADGMAKMETCYERNIYWALEGSERVEYLKERVSNDLHQLAWDLSAYSKYTDISDEARQNIAILTEHVQHQVNEQMKE